MFETSIPRAAISVATRILIEPERKPSKAACRLCCERLPCNEATLWPALYNCSVRRSTRCLVRTKTSTESVFVRYKSSSSNPVLRSCLTGYKVCETDVAGAVRPICTVTGYEVLPSPGDGYHQASLLKKAVSVWVVRYTVVYS